MSRGNPFPGRAAGRRSLLENQYLKNSLKKADFLTAILTSLVHYNGGSVTVPDPGIFKGRKMELHFDVQDDGAIMVTGGFEGVEPGSTVVTPEEVQNPSDTQESRQNEPQ